MATRSAAKAVGRTKPEPRTTPRGSPGPEGMRAEILHVLRAVALLIGIVLALGWLVT
jgi:hypothetical protein